MTCKRPFCEEVGETRAGLDGYCGNYCQDTEAIRADVFTVLAALRSTLRIQGQDTEGVVDALHLNHSYDTP